MEMSLYAAAEKVNPLVPHTAELIVGAVAFSLLFLVLRSRVVPMFEKAFTERTAAIQGGMERAEKAQLEAQRALAQYNDHASKIVGEALDDQARQSRIVDRFLDDLEKSK
jgi:F-type H+-transporting ATPase subunit b